MIKLWNGLPALGETEFVKTGFEKFDNIANGINCEGMTLVGGATGVGKSLVLLSLALGVSRYKRVLYISCENTTKTDMNRIDKFSGVYHISEINMLYINIDDIDKPIGEVIGDGIKEGAEIVFIDSPDVLIGFQDTGVELHSAGRKLAMDIEDYTKKQHIPIVMSWQLSRGAANKDLASITVDDFSVSTGLCHKAVAVYAVGKQDNQRQLKLVKCRTEYNYSEISYIIEHNGDLNMNGDSIVF